jgi:hypothetical protein
MRVTMRVIGIAGLVAGAVLLVSPMPGQAKPRQASHEPFGTYEDWSNPNETIRSDRWRGAEDAGGQEIMRKVRHLHLNMRFRLEGATNAGNTGFIESANILATTDPTLIDQIAGDARVKSLTVTECAANPRITRVRPFRLEIVKFNDGRSTGPTDRTGDYAGRVFASRDGDSTDAPGVLRVEGSLHVCDNADCSSRTRRGTVQLGTVTVGATFQLRVIWDKPNKRFLFGLDANPDQPQTYTASDSAAAVLPSATVDMRHSAASCTAGAVVIDAITRVSKIQTNTSAIIP